MVIVDDEKRYTQRLYEYLYAKFPIPMQIYIFTDLKKLREFSLQNEVEIALIAQHLYSRTLKVIPISNCYILQEKQKIKNKKNIYKYQDTKEIVKELLAYYEEDHSSDVIPDKKDMKIIGVYSPVKRIGQTTFSLLLGKLLAQKKRVLYINLEAYSGFYSSGGIYNTKNLTEHHSLSDLLYYIHSDEEKFVYKLANMIDYYGNLEYIPPSVSFLDLRIINEEEWKKLIEILRNKTKYEYLILDLSESVNGLFSVLRLCNKIYSLIRDDHIAKNKIEHYELLLKLLEYDDVLEKEKRVCIPEFQNMNLNPEELPYTQVGEFVRGIVKEDFYEG